MATKIAPTKTYASASAALAGARALASRGLISKSDLERVTKQLKSQATKGKPGKRSLQEILDR